MKKVVIGLIVVAGGVSMWATADKEVLPPMPEQASARGSVHWESPQHKEHGVGLLVFEVAEHGRIMGTLTFAGEHSHDYPDIVVQLDNIDMLQFTRQTVRMAGIGTFHHETVFITLFGHDGEIANTPDTFELNVIDINGEKVFEAEGEMATGDLIVGEPH